MDDSRAPFFSYPQPWARLVCAPELFWDRGKEGGTLVGLAIIWVLTDSASQLDTISPCRSTRSPGTSPIRLSARSLCKDMGVLLSLRRRLSSMCRLLPSIPGGLGSGNCAWKTCVPAGGTCQRCSQSISAPYYNRELCLSALRSLSDRARN